MNKDYFKAAFRDALPLLREALADYGHPNFTDRGGMAGRLQAMMNRHQHACDVMDGKKPTTRKGHFNIPGATLRLECSMTNPPKPQGMHVRTDNESIAIIPLDEFERAWEFYQQRQKAWEARNGASQKV